MLKLSINLLMIFLLAACSTGQFQNDGTDRGKIITYKSISDGTDRYGDKTETVVVKKQKSSSTEKYTDKKAKEEVVYKLEDTSKKGEELFLYPIRKPVVSKDYGEGSISGIEFSINTNENIYVVAPGMVIFSGIRPSLGNSIFVYHNNGYVSIYTNLDTINFKKGDYIRDADAVVGTANSKFSFELRKRTDKGVVPIDPKKYLSKRT